MPDCGLRLPCDSTVTSDTTALTITNNGDGSALDAISTSGRGAVVARNTGEGPAIEGIADGEIGLVGTSTGGPEGTGGVIGVAGFCPSNRFSTGVLGSADEGTGVEGRSDSGEGVTGRSRTSRGVVGTSTTGTGVFGSTDSDVGVEATAERSGIGVAGHSADGDGVFGISEGGPGVRGLSTGGSSATGNLHVGVYGSTTAGGVGVFGDGDADPVGGGTGIVGTGLSSGSRAAFFDGDVHVHGVVIFTNGGFRIDHPLEPASRSLSHSFVQSPEMKNVYDGVAALDERGRCRVELPAWFEALNCDFRYQLTSLGEPAPDLHVAQEISNNSFGIAGGKPGMKVSWQVTGIRKDLWAQAHPFTADEEKPESERGYYVHPESHGQPRENSTFWKGNVELIRRLEERRDIPRERLRITERRNLNEEVRKRSERLPALSRRLVGDEGHSGSL